MGRICKVDGYVVTVRPNERHHPRPHVHVIKSGLDASFFLDTEPPSPGPSSLRAKEWARALELACDYQTESLAEWNRIHGEEN